MSIVQTVRDRIKQAMRDKNAAERDLMKVVLGDLQMQETRKGEPLTEEEAQKVVRSMAKSAEETLVAANDRGDAALIAKTEEELGKLRSLLPQTLSVEQIVAALAPVVDGVKAAGNDGQATGVAMKHLKSSGAAVDGKDVAAAVKQLRA